MSNNSKLTVKDLVFIGIMSSLALVINLVVGMLLMPAMALFVVGSGGVNAMVMALPYFLIAFKVNKRKVFIVYTLVQSVLYLLMGYPVMLIVIVPLGLICEAIMWKKDSYRSLKKNTMVWSVYGIIYALHGIILLQILGVDSFRGLFMENTKSGVIDFVIQIYTTAKGVVSVGALGGVGGLLGSIFSWLLLKKHFIKAGVVSVS